MPVVTTEVRVKTAQQGLHEITSLAHEALRDSRLQNGILAIFCRHTSCSLTLMENADPSARRDLEGFLNRLVPENDRHFTHTYEGSDDMPSPIKMALTRSSETIPFANGSLLLGTWQGIFLWEHRTEPHTRSIVVTVMGE